MRKFSAYGYPNIKATHKTTIEFTKDRILSVRGDCIVGVNSDFDLFSIKRLINKKLLSGEKSVKVIIKAGDIKEEVNAELNPDFNDGKEIVIRRSSFISKRTLAIKADKGAVDLDRRLLRLLKNPKQKVIVAIF